MTQPEKIPLEKHMSETQLLSEVVDHIGLLTLNRPDVMNAFTDTMRERLLSQLEQFSTNPDVRCVVITGAGKAFCAGGDIASMAQLQDDNATEVVEQRMTLGSQVVQLLRRMPQPVIAAVNGAAAGAGANLALSCDFRLGSDRALFAESFVRIGLVPDWGGFFFLSRLVGTAKAMELMMTGDRIKAEEALRLGLLNHVYPADRFREETLNFAHKLAAGPAETLARIKEGVYLGATASLEQALAYEYRTQKSIFLSDDAREGMRAFLAKRPPEFGKGSDQ